MVQRSTKVKSFQTNFNRRVDKAVESLFQILRPKYVQQVFTHSHFGQSQHFDLADELPLVDEKFLEIPANGQNLQIIVAEPIHYLNAHVADSLLIQQVKTTLSCANSLQGQIKLLVKFVLLDSCVLPEVLVHLG